MPVNILNFPDLRVLDFKETDTEYHVKAEPVAISRLCPHCGRSHDTIIRRAVGRHYSGIESSNSPGVRSTLLARV